VKKTRDAHNFIVVKPEENRQLENLRADARIILKATFKKYSRRV
jgi:uncharacterized protein (UPF0128 family)